MSVRRRFPNGETGISLPDIEMMPKIAAVFGTNMDYLYFGRASSASGVPAADSENVLDRSKQRHANRLIYY